MLYRYAMSHTAKVAWAPSITGGVVATVMSMISSWLCAIYVEQIATLGATYGSVGAVVVLLIWLSWNINAIFYGGAFATEMEIAWRTRGKPEIQPDGADFAGRVVSLSERRASRRLDDSLRTPSASATSMTTRRPVPSSDKARRCAPWGRSPAGSRAFPGRRPRIAF
jgi:hypothetical protein